MSKIVEGVFIGSYIDARNEDFLVKTQITHILSVAKEFGPAYPERYTYLHMGLSDKSSFDLTPHLDEAVAFIQNALNEGGRILVHCHRGISRSASCVIAYLMRQQKHSFKEALATCVEKRPQVKPNKGFVTCLLKYTISSPLPLAPSGLDSCNNSLLSPTSTSLPVWKRLSPKSKAGIPKERFSLMALRSTPFEEDGFSGEPSDGQIH